MRHETVEGIYINFEVCQSKLYQPTTAESNPLQGDTYPVDLIA